MSRARFRDGSSPFWRKVPSRFWPERIRRWLLRRESITAQRGVKAYRQRRVANGWAPTPHRPTIAQMDAELGLPTGKHVDAGQQHPMYDDGLRGRHEAR